MDPFAVVGSNAKSVDCLHYFVHLMGLAVFGHVLHNFLGLEAARSAYCCPIVVHTCL